ncbi:MAG: hypothetical protein FWC39_11620 [Bacteroidetes bacterium]|nr:hypothetical protein [Bacteroidota bacterium]
MATVTLQYNARNSIAQKMMEVIMAMDTVFTIKTPAKTRQVVRAVESDAVFNTKGLQEYRAGKYTIINHGKRK